MSHHPPPPPSPPGFPPPPQAPGFPPSSGTAGQPAATTAAPAGPRTLAEGVTVENGFGQDGSPMLRVVAQIPFPWRGRPPAAHHRPQYPGASVLFEDRWWEVLRVDPRPADGKTVYILIPWPEAAAIRHPFELDRATCERHREAHFEALREEERAQRLGWMFFFVALLPSQDQKQLSLRHGLDTTLATLISAAVLTSMSVFGLFLVFAMKKGMDMGAWRGVAELAASTWPILLYLAVEGLIRVASALAAGEPMGSALVVVPLTLVRALGGKSESIETRPGPWGSSADVRGASREWLTAMDEVQALPPDEEGRARLSVTSLLPKNHWSANVHGIDHRGRRYILVDRQRKTSDQGRGSGASSDDLFVFELQETRPEQLFRFIHQYYPEEVREVYKARQRMRIGTWVETFAFLWGTTRPELQNALAEVYPRYQPWRATLQSIVVFGLIGLVGLGQTALVFSAGNARVGHLFLGLGCLVLAWGAGVRALRFSAGEIVESFLGSAFEPLIRPALRWRRSPDWPHPDAEA